MAKRVIEVRIKRRLIDYIHNDLASSSRYFSERVAKRDAEGDRDGLFFEIISGLTMCAFSAEANYKFVAHKLGIELNDYANYHQKREAVFGRLGIGEKKEERPFSTLRTLHGFRTTFAHGKPVEQVTDLVETGTYDELYELMHSRPSWEETATPAFLTQAHHDVQEVWKLMVEKAEITLFETLGGGDGSMELVRVVSEGD